MNHSNKYRNFNEQHTDLTAEELIETYYNDLWDDLYQRTDIEEKNTTDFRDVDY